MTDRNKFSFASGNNANYVEGLYAQYKSDPASVDDTWRRFFEGYEFALQGDIANARAAGSQAKGGSAAGNVEALINAYRRLGHLNAHLNPLADKPEAKTDLKPMSHGLGDVKPDEVFETNNLGIGKPAPFSEITKFLDTTYCSKIGADYREINSIEEVVWLQEKMESCQNQPVFAKEMKLRILDKLIHAEGFERFLQDRYLGQKRFSIEGLDAMIPLMDILADDAQKQGAAEINIGMAHRGRLNVLANFMGKDYEQILKEFEGAEFNPLSIEGDVKYHKGFANTIDTFSGGKIRVYLSPNPSHLEVVNPVLEGFARSRQNLLGDQGRSKVLPILIHGDAAVIGQGVVPETLNLANLEAYHTGGTIHIIANNQLGFTANPDESKSCDYASDIAKSIRAPVLHVNGDDPEAVVWCAQLAVAYRQKFHKDVVIDVIGYRRHGHNETDEPSFTQPLMYKVVKKHPTVMKIYSDQLDKESVISVEDSKAKLKDFRAKLQKCLLSVREGNYEPVNRIPEEIAPSLAHTKVDYDDIHRPVQTQIDQKLLTELGQKVLNVPDSFTPHSKINKLFDNRKKMLEGDGSIDWGFAEILTYASIANEGTHVRLTGQDSRRGTFSHRHAVIRDFENDSILETLNQVGEKQGRVDVVNSPLSEMGCLGFEFGYSVADPKALVLWEAQFGDFVNGAQIIIDQFLVASEAKWKQAVRLVMLLPHGYEGQGPEHSSARPERFLQSCGNINIQVANLTTPAQLFHILRRQSLRDFKKPLVIMTPKSLLRHPKVISKFDDFCKSGFSEILDDKTVEQPEEVERIVMCTGKIYYDLLEAREKAEGKPIPLVRVEQLYPFPWTKIEDVIARYPNAKEICWAQEEPVNMGAWFFIKPRLESLKKKLPVKYCGRRGSGSTAEGSLKSHIMEQQRIVHEAVGLTSSIGPNTKSTAARA